MPRKPKPERPRAEVLAQIPAEILDQIVRDGPLTAEEIDTASAHRRNRRYSWPSVSCGACQEFCVWGIT